MLGRISLSRKHIPDLKRLIASLESVPEGIELGLEADWFDRGNPAFQAAVKEAKAERPKGALKQDAIVLPVVRDATTRLLGRPSIQTPAGMITSLVFAEKIRDELDIRNLSLTTVARTAGCSRTYISRQLNGNDTIRPALIKYALNTLGLFGGKS